MNHEVRNHKVRNKPQVGRENTKFRKHKLGIEFVLTLIKGSEGFNT